MYKGWNYKINGFSGSDNFEVIFSPNISVSIEIASLITKQDLKQIRQFYEEQSSGNCMIDAWLEKGTNDKKYLELISEEGKHTLLTQWLSKITGIKVRKVFQQPSGLFTSFNKRKNEVETKAEHYIDSELGDLISWLKKHPETLK